MRSIRKNKYARQYVRMLRLEPLEDRALLAITPQGITLQGIPNYQPQGPGPIVGAQSSSTPHNEAVGAVNAVVHTSTGLLVGTVDGGIWRTTNPNAVDDGSLFSPGHVAWTPLTDQFPSLSISSLATSPTLDSVVYAGIADTSSSGGDGGSLTGILRSTDGGDTWRQLGQRPPAVAPVENDTVSANFSGALQAGTYFLKYTYVNPGGESQASLESAPITVTLNAATGGTNAPRVFIPPLPPGVTGVNIYLTPSNGASGAESILYATNVVPKNYDLFQAPPTFPGQPAPSRNTTLPTIPDPSTDPAMAPIITVAGGVTGGGLAPGSYFLQYTFVGQSGESMPSPDYQIPLVDTAGEIPVMTLKEAVPAGANGINIYLTSAGGAKGTETLYASLPPAGFDLAARIVNEPPLTDTTSPNVGIGAAASVDPTGGGVGGGLPVGNNYALQYTWINAGGETTASQPVSFNVTGAGDVPRVTLPPLRFAASGVRLYLTLPGGAAGSELLYPSPTLVASTFRAMTFDLQAPPPAPSTPPLTNTLAWNGPGPAPDPFQGGLAGLNVVRVAPTGVDTQGLVSAPPDQQVVLAATNGGVFLSSDGGQTWSNESARPGSGLPAGAAVSDLVYDPNTEAGAANLGPSMFYAAIPGQGVFGAVFQSNKLVNFRRPLPQLPLVWTAIDGPNLPPAANTTSTPLANPPVNDPGTNDASPTVNSTGGGSTGGNLPAGKYFVEFTWTDAGGQTLVSAESLPFTVSAGNVPEVFLPAPPTGATGENIFLTPAGGPSGSEILYASDVPPGNRIYLAAAPPPNTGLNAWPTVYSLPVPGSVPPTSTLVFSNVALTTRILLAVEGAEVWTALIQKTSAGDQMAGIFASGNQGADWTSWGVPTDVDGQALDSEGQGLTHDAIIADNDAGSVHKGYLYVGGDAYLGSNGDTNQGDLALGLGPGKWVHIVGNSPGTFQPNYGAPHADTRRLYFYGGKLFAATDGGLYNFDNPRLDTKFDVTSQWESMNGNLMVNEQYAAAYAGGVVTAASQDNGVDQQAGPGQGEWNQVDTGDGWSVQVAPDNSFYSASNGGMIHISADFLGFNDHTGMNVNGQALDTVDPGAEENGQSGRLAQFPWAVNAVDPKSLLFGTARLYESHDSGDDLNDLGPIGAAVPDAPPGPGGGDGGSDDKYEFQKITALAYGGYAGDTPYPDIAYVAAGNILTLRSAARSTHSTFPAGASVPSRSTPITGASPTCSTPTAPSGKASSRRPSQRPSGKTSRAIWRITRPTCARSPWPRTLPTFCWSAPDAAW